MAKNYNSSENCHNASDKNTSNKNASRNTSNKNSYGKNAYDKNASNKNAYDKDAKDKNSYNYGNENMSVFQHSFHFNPYSISFHNISMVDFLSTTIFINAVYEYFHAC